MFGLTWTKRDLQSACLLCFYSAWFLLCLHNKRDADCAPDGGVLMVFLSKVISQQHYNDFALKIQSVSFMYLFIYFHDNKFFPFLRKTDECVLWGSDYTLISRVSGCCSCGVFFLSPLPQIAVSGYIFATCFLFGIQKRAQLLICISVFLLCSHYRAKDQGTVGEKMTDGQGIRNTTHRDGYY